jgi:hypothetical protein
MVGIQYGILMYVKVLDLSVTGIMAPYSDRGGYTVPEG